MIKKENFYLGVSVFSFGFSMVALSFGELGFGFLLLICSGIWYNNYSKASEDK